MPGPCEPRNPPFQGTRSRINCKLSMTGKLELMNETPSGRRRRRRFGVLYIRDKTILAYYDDDSILSSNLMTRYFLPTNFYNYLYRGFTLGLFGVSVCTLGYLPIDRWTTIIIIIIIAKLDGHPHPYIDDDGILHIIAVGDALNVIVVEWITHAFALINHE